MKLAFPLVLLLAIALGSGATTYYFLHYLPARDRATTITAITTAHGEAAARHADQYLYYYASKRNESYAALWDQTTQGAPQDPIQLLETIEAHAPLEARDPSLPWEQVVQIARDKDGIARFTAFQERQQAAFAEQRQPVWLPLGEWHGDQPGQSQHTVQVTHPNAHAGRLRVSFTPTDPYGHYAMAIAIYNHHGQQIQRWEATTTTTEEIPLPPAQAYTIDITAQGAWTITAEQAITSAIHQADQAAAAHQAAQEAAYAADNPTYQYHNARAPMRRKLTPEERRPTTPGYTYTRDGANTNLTIPTTTDQHGRRIQITAPN